MNPIFRRGIAILLGLTFGLFAGAGLQSCHQAPEPGPPVADPGDDPAPPPGKGDIFDSVVLDGDGPIVLRAYASLIGHDMMPPIEAGCWRAGPGRDEERQSFPDYKQSGPVRADDQYKVIVLQPIGPFDAQGKKTLELVREYTEAFFGCPCELRDSLPLPTRGKRIHHGREQILTKSIMDGILLRKLPPNAITYLGVTMTDLYPKPSWNYVFGEAYLYRRVGVYSLARYRAAFWGETPSPATRKRALRRACKVLAHETGHMFGLPHCDYFACTMNGSNHLQEADAQPLWLCPVCASKLTWNRGTDPQKRFEALAAFFTKIQLTDAAEWYDSAAKRIASLR